jgi:hypothetical protein
VTIDGSGATGVTITGDADGDDVLFPGTQLTHVQATPSSALNDNTRVLNATGDTTLVGLTITGGLTTGQNEDGGGVLVDGDLVLRDSTVAGNATTGRNSEGGGLKTTGDVHIVDSTVTDNLTRGDNARGGGVHSTGEAIFVRSTLSNNSTEGNEGDGGGIRADGSAGVTLVDSTVSGNTTFGTGSSGTGVQARNGDIFAINTTVADNIALQSNGGGLHSSKSVDLLHATVTGNFAGTEGGGVNADSDLSAVNSIVVGNGASSTGDEINVGGSLTPINSMLSGDASEIFETTAVNASKPGILQGVLGDNGGPTQTVALLRSASNSAIDGGDLVGTLARALDETALGLDLNGDGDTDDVLQTIADFANDQRGPGNARDVDLLGDPLSGTRDIGAVELQSQAGLVVNTNLDVIDAFDGLTSLREALIFADQAAGVDTITFDSDVFTGGEASLIRLTRGQELFAQGQVVIDGSGATDLVISGDVLGDDNLLAGTFITDVQGSGEPELGDNTRVLRLGDGGTLNDLTITGGLTFGANQEGGGVRSLGDLTLTNVEISGNMTNGANADGGGVSVDGTLTATSSIFAQNFTFGINAVGGGIRAVGDSTITDSVITGNQSSASGGGISSIDGTLVVRDSLIDGNSSSNFGGGIRASILEVFDSTISNNDSQIGGGLSALTARFENTTVSGNTAAEIGGGANIASAGFTMLNCSGSDVI